MDYIVFDLEWNQAGAGRDMETAGLPFEIIEIGAVRLSCAGTPGGDGCTIAMAGEFSRLIKPTVYREMHQITGELIHLKTCDLERGVPFVTAVESFLQWCGEGCRFCTWGSADLTELQRNMKFRGMPPLAEGPFVFLDVQKLFSLAFEGGKTQKSLEHAIDFLGTEKDAPFHRAAGDAYYTAKVLTRIMEERPEVLAYHSYNVFHPPADRESEVRIRFPGYMKYISREFDSKEDAFADREVVSSKCYLCHRNLRKKMRWFTPNGRNYYCLAYCEKHGFLKSKIRIRKSENDRLYIAKTTKFISPEEAESLKERRLRVKKLHSRRSAQDRESP